MNSLNSILGDNSNGFCNPCFEQLPIRHSVHTCDNLLSFVQTKHAFRFDEDGGIETRSANQRMISAQDEPMPYRLKSPPLCTSWGKVPRSVPLKIEGLNNGQFCPEDIFNPVIRLYPPPYGRKFLDSQGLDYLRQSPFIEHVDVTTIWKGITLTDAKMLFYLHQAFKASLEKILAEVLDELYKTFRQEFMGYRPNLSQSPIDLLLTRQATFSRSQLVQNIVEVLKPLEQRSADDTTQGAMRLLPIYLSTCDRFMNSDDGDSQDTIVEVSMRAQDHSHVNLSFLPVIEVAWIPDLVSFEQVSEYHREGEELRIIPQYRSNNVFANEPSDTSVHYSVTSAQKWLIWDQSISGFKGTVPMYSGTRSPGNETGEVYGAHRDGSVTVINVVRVEIKATFTQVYRPCVRVEKAIRVRLTLKIIPWYSRKGSGTLSEDSIKLTPYQMPRRLYSQSSAEDTIPEVKPHHMRWSDIYVDNMPQVDTSKITCKGMPTSSRAPRDLQPPTTPLSKSRKRCTSSSPDSQSPTKKCRENGNDLWSNEKQGSSFMECTSGSPPESKSTLSSSRQRSEPLQDFFHNRFAPLCSDTLSSDGEDSQPIQLESFGRSVATTLPIRASRSAGSVTTRCTSDTSGSLSDKTENKAVENPTGKSLLPQGATNTSLDREIAFEHDEAILDPSDSEVSGSCHNACNLELIIEDANVDPETRKEQALLWKILCTQQRKAIVDDPTLSPQERKNLYNAIKHSTEEQEQSMNPRKSDNDVLDDIFLEDSSSEPSDNEQEFPSDQGNSETCGEKVSDHESTDLGSTSTDKQSF